MSANEVTKNISLEEFFTANGFNAIDIPNSAYSDIYKEFIESEGIIRIWEKWYGRNFLNSGGIRAMEKINNDKTVIVIDSWSRDMQASETALNLSRWIESKYPEITVEYHKDAYLDFR